jgi:Zn-dependent protease
MRLKQNPAYEIEDARSGLAGPVWGFFAALVCFAVFLGTGVPIMGALAKVGAQINLFNLMPIWTLDGGRGMRALATRERWMVAGTALLAGYFTGDIWGYVIGAFSLFKAFAKDGPEKSDRQTLFTFVALILALSFLSAIDIPGLPNR